MLTKSAKMPVQWQSHMTQSLWHYELLSEAASDTILTIQYTKTEANSLENAGCPITWPDTVVKNKNLSQLNQILIQLNHIKYF
jgi:hypothetical protein